MAFLAKGDWVVVADQGRAIVLENRGDAARGDLRQVEGLQAEVAELTDRPGRMPDPAPGQRSAMEDPDPARMAAERMVKDLAGWLEQAAREGRYARLVIVAAPAVLGVIRAERGDEAASRTIVEIDRNLISHPLPQIAEAVSRALAAA